MRNECILNIIYGLLRLISYLSEHQLPDKFVQEHKLFIKYLCQTKSWNLC
jgi:hypothetical protein